MAADRPAGGAATPICVSSNVLGISRLKSPPDRRSAGAPPGKDASAGPIQFYEDAAFFAGICMAHLVLSRVQ
jgi:hypothetical protein